MSEAPALCRRCLDEASAEDGPCPGCAGRRQLEDCLRGYAALAQDAQTLRRRVCKAVAALRHYPAIIAQCRALAPSPWRDLEAVCDAQTPEEESPRA